MKKIFTLKNDAEKIGTFFSKRALIIIFLFISAGIYSLIHAQGINDMGSLKEDIGFNLSDYHVLYVGLTPTDSLEAGRMDGSFTLSLDTITTWGDYSISVRFDNWSGTDSIIDCRNGGGFAVDEEVSFTFNELHHCWIETAVYDETYSVYIQTEGMTEPVKIAADYAYRKTSISELAFWSSLYNPSHNNNDLAVSNLNIVNKVGVIPIADSVNATLSLLSLSNGHLSPLFSPDSTSYTAISDYGTTSVEVTAVPNIEGASITGTGTVDVSSGSGTATITVTALDGTTTKVYSVEITVRQTPSDNANLASLTVAGSSLVPAFDPEVIKYKSTVPYETTSVNVSAEPADTNANVSGTGSVDVSSETGGTATVTVTAEDGSTTKTYTVEIIKDHSAVTQISESEIRITPNPTNDLFHIALNGIFEYKVYNLSGMLITNGIANNNYTFGHELNQGTYILKISRDNQLGTYKLIKL